MKIGISKRLILNSLIIIIIIITTIIIIIIIIILTYYYYLIETDEDFNRNVYVIQQCLFLYFIFCLALKDGLVRFYYYYYYYYYRR